MESDNKLLSGYGENVITPKLPSGLAGYGFYIDREAFSSLDDIKVRAVYLQDFAGNNALLVSLDLIGLDVAFCDSLRKLLSLKFSINFDSIFISCTHTHSGPPAQKMRGLGELDPGYLEFIRDKTAQAVDSAVSRPRQAEAKWNLERIEPIGFNRVTHKGEPLDDYLGVIVLKQKNRKTYILNSRSAHLKHQFF